MLLLRNGYGRSSRFWYAWVRYLTRHVKVVRPDLRGLGESPAHFNLEKGLSDLPVEQPTLFDLVVNLNTAKAPGISVPRTTLTQATSVLKNPMRDSFCAPRDSDASPCGLGMVQESCHRAQVATSLLPLPVNWSTGCSKVRHTEDTIA